MRYEGKIYRPWIEAESLLIQVTLGCSNNRCTFCTMFKDKKFRIRERDDIFRDIDAMRAHYPEVRSIFLIDGNVMVLKTPLLLQIIEKIKATFPECEHIALYTELNDLRRKPVEELIALREAGLTTGYAGLESGDPVTLERIHKGMTPEQALEGMANAKAAGITMLLSFIFGLGGRARSVEHITETTRLLNRMEPEQIAPMALTVQPGSVLERQVESGEFILPTPRQILEEERHLLEHLSDFETYYWGDHGNNILPARGGLPYCRETFLEKVNEAIASHPVTGQDVLHTFAW